MFSPHVGLILFIWVCFYIPFSQRPHAFAQFLCTYDMSDVVYPSWSSHLDPLQLSQLRPFTSTKLATSAHSAAQEFTKRQDDQDDQSTFSHHGQTTHFHSGAHHNIPTLQHQAQRRSTMTHFWETASDHQDRNILRLGWGGFCSNCDCQGLNLIRVRKPRVLFHRGKATSNCYTRGRYESPPRYGSIDLQA